MRAPIRPGWRGKAQRFLALNPFCANCGAPATDADHIIPRPEGHDGWDNLQALCHGCHSRKTDTIDGHGWQHYRRRRTTKLIPSTTIGQW